MKKWRTIIMSDFHLGARQSQTNKILKFLEENESETLILKTLRPEKKLWEINDY